MFWFKRTSAVAKTDDAESLPSEFFDHVQDVLKYTPDMHHLQTYEKVRLFVYGEDMSSMPKYEELLGEFEPEATAFTFENFETWKHKLGKETYPIALEKRSSTRAYHAWAKADSLNPPWAKVKGEVYLVPPERIFFLDSYRKNGVEFVRKRVHLILPFRHVKYPGFPQLQDMKAWMYVGKPDYWADRLDAGANFAPVRPFNNVNTWAKHYTHFTRLEQD
jgi:hypothetical protein